jgi:hypothetical protein
MNKKILIVSLIVFLGLSIAIYQYAKELQSEFTSAAYSTSKPANGHSWSEMECTAGLCVTSGDKVGIGTDNPTEKLEVIGNFKASGDVCNGTGNCLSALTTLTNACGGAQQNYIYSASAYSGTFCAMGSSTPASPSFPAAGASTTWTCPVANDPTHPISCTATHAAAPIAGVCGPAATSYPFSATTYTGAYCTAGTTSASPAFPSAGNSSNWSCLGVNEGASPSCTASRANPLPLVNSAHNEAECVTAGGTVVASDVTYNQCRFSAAACPSLWTQYKSYYRKGGNYCSCDAGSCTTSIGSWGNPGTAVDNCMMCGTWNCFDVTCSGCYPCAATITQIGCY